MKHPTIRASALALLCTLTACAPDRGPTDPTMRPVQAAIASVPATVIVTSAGDAGPGTLRDALANAVNGDVIGFAPGIGTITLSSRILVTFSGAVVIQGGAERVTISGNGATELLGALNLTTMTLRHLAFRDAYSTIEAGSAVNSSGPLVLEDVTFTNNTSTWGGAVFANSSLTITDCQFVNNTASKDGGAVGAKGVLQITGSLFTGNGATGNGGAVEAEFGSVTTIVGSTFTLNRAERGAGMELVGNATVSTSTMSYNAANGDGGGMNAFGDITIENSTISGNVANGFAGGVLFGGGAVHVRHTTIANNTAGSNNAAIFGKYANPFEISGSIISGNLPAAFNCGPSSFTSVTPTLVDTSSCSTASGTILGAALLGPLADNGGPTFTHALLDGSKAIDAAANCLVTVDQRGVSRPQGAGCDLGAVEFNNFARPTLTIDPSGTVSASRGNAFVGGTQSCSRTAPVTLQVTGTQAQKAGKVNTTVSATAQITVACGTSASVWAAALTPTTGAFSTAPMTVTVKTLADPIVTPTTATLSGIKLSWSKR